MLATNIQYIRVVNVDSVRINVTTTELKDGKCSDISVWIKKC